MGAYLNQIRQGAGSVEAWEKAKENILSDKMRYGYWDGDILMEDTAKTRDPQCSVAEIRSAYTTSFHILHLAFCKSCSSPSRDSRIAKACRSHHWHGMNVVSQAISPVNQIVKDYIQFSGQEQVVKVDDKKPAAPHEIWANTAEYNNINCNLWSCSNPGIGFEKVRVYRLDSPLACLQGHPARDGECCD